MTPEESSGAIEMLFKKLEALLAENAALEIGLEFACMHKKQQDREALRLFISQQKLEFLTNHAEAFAWLRGTILSSVSGTHPQPTLLPEWEAEVQRLIDGAKPVDRAE